MTSTKYQSVLVTMAVFYILLSGTYVVSDMFTGTGFNLSVMYHLYTGVQGAGFGDYVKEMAYTAGFVICAIMLSLSHTFRKESKLRFMKITPLISLPLALSLFAVSPWLNNYFEQIKIYVSGLLDRQDVSNEYIVNRSDVINKKI